MRLREVLEIAQTTELKQVHVGNDEKMIYSLLNLALVDVYAKLNFLQEEQLIKMEANRTRYRLLDNSQRILNVYTRLEEGGPVVEVPINDVHADFSVFTPQPYVLHVPRPIDGETLSVIQTIVPPYITPENIDTVDVIVPPHVLEPLVSYMGYRAHISVDGGEQSEWGSYYRRYLQTLNDAMRMMNPQLLTNVKLIERGFV